MCMNHFPTDEVQNINFKSVNYMYAAHPLQKEPSDITDYWR